MKERRDPKLSPASRQLAFTGWITGADEPQGSDQWFTPPELVESIRDFFGGDIDLDPCASPHAHVHARVAYTQEHDGLTLPWVGRIAGFTAGDDTHAVDIRSRFVNPPYSKPLPWIERLAELHSNGPGTPVPCIDDDPGDSIALIKADPTTRTWQHAWTADAVLFFAKRIAFARPSFRSVTRASAPFPCALLYWGPHADGFEDWFSELGHVCRPTPSQVITQEVERARADAITQVDEPIVDLSFCDRDALHVPGQRCERCGVTPPVEGGAA